MKGEINTDSTPGVGRPFCSTLVLFEDPPGVFWVFRSRRPLGVHGDSPLGMISAHSRSSSRTSTGSTWALSRAPFPSATPDWLLGLQTAARERARERAMTHLSDLKGLLDVNPACK